MLLSKFQNMSIYGMSVALPNQIVPVESFIDTFGKEIVSDFSSMTGVKSVSRALPEQTASDLGYEAAANLIEKSKIDIEEIGLLVFVTQKPDFRVPSTAFLIHKRLGLNNNCTCFDINLACSGFIYALQTGFSMLKNSDSKMALIITGDTSIRTLSKKDRSMVMLFGDSGTATLIQKDEKDVSTQFAFRTDGNRFKSIITPSGAYRGRNEKDDLVLWNDGIERSYYDTQMKGMDVFGFSISDVPKLMKEFIKEINMTPEEYDYLILHQANKYILQKIGKKLKISMDKIPVSLDKYGNNSSNSIPLVLADHFGDENIGEIKILMSGFGAGLSWACSDLTIDTANIYPLIKTDKYYKG